MSAERAQKGVQNINLDFSKDGPSLADRGARGATDEQLARLFERLGAANELFENNRTASTSEALHAVVEFLNASPHNGNGQFSRPLELLLAQTRPAPVAGLGSGGVNAATVDDHVQAAAAYTLEFLHPSSTAKRAPGLKATAISIANELRASGFNFGKNRKKTDEANAVSAWRRDFPKRLNGPAAMLFREHIVKPPVQRSGINSTDALAIRAWFTALLARAGYGATF